MFEKNHGNSIAIISDNGLEVTYDDLYKRSLEIRKKITSEKLVLLCADNSCESIIIYYSCILHKIPLMIISNDLNEDQLLQIIDSYMPNFIFCKKEYSFDRYNSSNTFPFLSSYNFYEQKEYKKININSQLLLLLSTSGSTGSIKFVRLSEKNIQSNSSAISSYLKLSQSDRAITTMPMAYTFGLSIINSHLDVGASIIATNKTVLDKDFWTLISDYNVTSISGVPYFFEILIKTGFLKRRISSLRYITQAGGKLDQINKIKLLSYCDNHKIDFFVMYGQTEATARMSYVPPSMLRKKIDSIGLPIDNGKFKIGNNGEIIYEGPNVSLGYAENKNDLGRGDDNKGILCTGDLGHLDSDGFYFITGRIKRFVKIFGLRISLDEVEDILESNFFDNEFICFDNKTSIKIIYTNEIDEKQLIKFISNKLKLNIKAFCVEKTDLIPRNNSGKKIYK